MSVSLKQSVPARDPEHFTCCVGYDPAHDSYFVYVAKVFKNGQNDGEEFDGHTVLWLGTRHREIDSVEDLAGQLQPFAELPEALYQTLRDLRLAHARPQVHKSSSSMSYLRSK